MESYTYTIERKDTKNFHGWLVIESSEGLETVIHSCSSLDEAKAVKAEYEEMEFNRKLEELAHEESHEDLFGW